MEILNYFKCSHCFNTAREYKGLEGAIYIGAGTSYECPKSSNSEHNFLKVTDKKEITKLLKKDLKGSNRIVK